MKKFTDGMSLSAKINILCEGDESVKASIIAAALSMGPKCIPMFNNLDELEIYGKDVTVLLIGVCEGSLMIAETALEIEMELKEGDLQKFIAKRRGIDPNEDYMQTAVALRNKKLAGLKDNPKAIEQIRNKITNILSMLGVDVGEEMLPTIPGQSDVVPKEVDIVIGAPFDEEKTVGTAEPDILASLLKAKRIK